MGRREDMWEDAHACALAAIRAADAALLTETFMHAHFAVLHKMLGDGSVQLLAIGKAARSMACGALNVLGPRLSTGVVLTNDPIDRGDISRFQVIEVTHPFPSAENVRGAELVRRAVVQEGPPLLCLVSGGASAALTLPRIGITCEDVSRTTRLLLEHGGTIEELNTVRKHLDQLKGGQLAVLARGRPLLTLVLSDVVGDNLAVIGSGPTVPDPSTFEDCARVLKRVGVWNEVPESVRALIVRGVNGLEPETPDSDHAVFTEAQTFIVGTNTHAREGAAAEARRRGYEVTTSDEAIVGEARVAGEHLVDAVTSSAPAHSRGSVGLCFIYGGETIVHVRGQGAGGRNQELVISAALRMAGIDSVVVASVSTDGIDGASPAAGAVVDGETAKRAREAGIDLESALRENDSFSALSSLGATILTGPTGTNVMDVQIVLCQ
jgi:glycerate 2-kinase